jgi:hypothetical protein
MHKPLLPKTFISSKKDEFQVQTYGNLFFTGCTKSISLLNGKYTLPPSCILFEGYGNVKPGILRVTFPSRGEDFLEYNGLEAFVTFFHPSSKYSGPGIDGVLSRELVITTYPSMNQEKLLHPKREVE